MRMDEIGNVLDKIHEHMAKTDRINPEYRQEFQELDKNIRAMKQVQNDNAATELASLDRNGPFSGCEVRVGASANRCADHAFIDAFAGYWRVGGVHWTDGHASYQV